MSKRKSSAVIDKRADKSSPCLTGGFRSRQRVQQRSYFQQRCHNMRLVRLTRVSLIIVGTMLVAALPPIAAGDGDAAAVSAFSIRRHPITLALARTGDFGDGRFSWFLSVNSAGQAQLTVDKGRTFTSRSFNPSEQQLSKLREVLVRERFFDLREEYGEVVAGGSTDTLSVAIGENVKTVKIHFLMNWVLHDRAKLREPARAVRVWTTIRGWFNDADASDGGDSNRRVLDAVRQLGEE